MKLIWVVIPLVLIGIVGIQESFAETGNSKGKITWSYPFYLVNEMGIITITDSDMNIRHDSIDSFKIKVWSDSDEKGLEVTMKETGKDTGVFEGNVFFTTAYESLGQILKVKEGDDIIARYIDTTLPTSYSETEIEIRDYAKSGYVPIPPLRSSPVYLRITDTTSNSIDSVSVDQQIQLETDLKNKQDRVQPFAYLVQIQDSNGVTVSLAWITGTLSSNQSFTPSLSWIPTKEGTYTAVAFVWESITNPTALSPPISTTFNVK